VRNAPVGKAGRSNHPLFTQFVIHFVLMGRAYPDIADFLDFPANTEFAPGSRDESRHPIHRKRKQSGHTKDAETDSQTATRTAVHKVADEEACGRAKDCGSREGASFHPYRGRINMLV